MPAKIRRLLLSLAIAAGWFSPATADEQLVMPFACRVEGGQVFVAPSAPQTYQIHGRRESKQLTTCSPLDPRNCHDWSIHRFNLDCGGSRTSWQAVVRALSPVLLESVGIPAVTYAGRNNGRAGAGQAPPWAYAPERFARPGRGPVIDFPPGFAPNPMKVASFVQVKAAPARVPLPPKKPISTAPSLTAEVPPSLEPIPAQSSAVGEADAVTTASLPERKTTEVAKSEPPQIALDSGNVETTGSLPPSGATSNSLWRDTAMVFAFTFVALVALSVTLLMRRRGMLALSPPTPQSPHGPAGLPSLARSSLSVAKEPINRELGDIPATRLRLWDEGWLPATMNEAFDVLGVDPDASKETMKRTVARLRRALHPDHALDEDDRRLRERRLKQINVAWDIVSGKRPSLWLSVGPKPA